MTSKLLQISSEELELVIQNTADKLNMSNAIVEKDLWVCIILKYLFKDLNIKTLLFSKAVQIYRKYIS